MKQYQRIGVILSLGFLLGIHNGKIALWQDDDPQPIKVFPYSASCLPEADQKALHKGIPINSKEDLSQLLEDFFS